MSQILQDNLRNAIILAKREEVKSLLSLGAEADFKGTEKQHYNTPIHLAAYNKHVDMLSDLIESLPVDKRYKALNEPNLNGATPLFEAVWITRPPREEDSKEYIAEYNRMIKEMPQTFELLLTKGARNLAQECNIGNGTKISVSPWINHQLRKDKLGNITDCRENSALQQCRSILDKHISLDLLKQKKLKSR